VRHVARGLASEILIDQATASSSGGHESVLSHPTFRRNGQRLLKTQHDYKRVCKRGHDVPFATVR
jgi:hypothetical protein